MITFDRKERQIWGLSQEMFNWLDNGLLLYYGQPTNQPREDFEKWVYYTDDQDGLYEFLPDPDGDENYYAEWDDLVALMNEDNYDIIYFTYLDFPHVREEDI